MTPGLFCFTLGRVEIEVIRAHPDKECCSCGATNIALWRIPPEPLIQAGEHLHCELCYGTMAGRACREPRYNSETVQIMRHVNLVANILLRKLKENPNDMARKVAS